MKFMNVKNIVISITVLLTVVSAQVTYNVSGVVELEDQTGSSADHSGVKMKFFNLPSMDPEDSTTTNTNGTYSINVSPGYYLVVWTKDGYVPWELGGLALAANTVLDSIILIPGEVSEVSGTISTTTWTTSYVYYVTDDITIDAGETLTINAGVRVKFYDGKGMTVNGKLLANGTADEHVLFTSKEPTPLPGDWTNIVLNGENNVLTYVAYEYATDGFTGDGASGSTFDHLTMVGSLSLTANGIYLTNSSNMTFTSNTITVSGEYGIFSENSSGSLVNNNIISGVYSTAAIRMQDCDNCEFDGNTITFRPYRGIWTQYADNTSFTNNNIDVGQTGIESQDGSYLTIENNTITNFEEYGIYFNSSSVILDFLYSF